MQGFTRWVLRARYWIVILGVLLTGISGYFSWRLYGTLKPDLEELLPTSARSVRDLREVRDRLRSFDNLAVLVFSQHPKESERFVDDLARRLQSLAEGDLHHLIGRVEYRIDRELRFFKERRALYMDLGDLRRIRGYIEDRLQYEQDIRNPLNIFSGASLPEPRLDFNAIASKYSTRTAAFTRFPDGYYATPDGKKRVVLVFMAGHTGEISALKELKARVEGVVAELDPRSYAPDLEVHYTGNVANSIEEQDAILADILKSLAIVTLLVTLVLVLFFRSWKGVTALMVALFMGTLWTFGASYFLVGNLNANSAFLGSIILGNGINFGIILTARYLEERRKGRLRDVGLRLAANATSSATWTAALAAGLSYGSLMLTSFRGFRQFGVIGFIGMIFCWFASFTILPALLAILERDSAGPRLAAPPKSERTEPGNRTGPAGTSDRRRGWARAAVVATLGLIALSLLQLRHLGSTLLEADLLKIRSKESLEKGSGYYSRFVDEIFERYLTPVVVLPRDKQGAARISERLAALSRRQGSDTLIASVQTVEDFLPKQQGAKIRVLREIRALLTPKILKQLSSGDRKLVADFLRPEAFRPVRLQDLPPVVLERFREKDGSLGRLVLVEPPIGDRPKQRDLLFRFVRELRETADSVQPGTPVAGTLPVTADMLRSITEDGPRATLFAFCAVVLLVSLLFRHVQTSLRVLGTLFLGVIWLGGFILGYEIKINFLNFIALPITFGIGVDYGVNIFQRYRQEGPGSIPQVVRETGSAVGVCSLTTIIGYGSLLFATNQAFFSFGLIATLGEVTCILAALVSVPAFLYLRDQRQAKAGEERRRADWAA